MHPSNFQALRQASLDPLAVTIAEAQRISGFSRSAIYRDLTDGHLKAVKLGSRTLVLTESIRARLASLPPATFRAARAAA